MTPAEQQWLENRISAAVDDDFYLDRDEEKRIKEESAAKGILIRDIELTIRTELDRHGAVCERILIDQLDRLLHQFTDNDKELDSKEERDALDKVLIPVQGKKKGLDPRVAEAYVDSFCKVNGVRRNTEAKKRLMPYIIIGVCIVLAVGAFAILKKNPESKVSATPSEAVKSTPSSDNTVILTEKDRAEIDDQLRRANQFIEESQYTDPPEMSAKACLDQIRQIDPNGQYRGSETKRLASIVVDHYIDLAKQSSASHNPAEAKKWLSRARLMNTDREQIIDAERELGLTSAGG